MQEQIGKALHDLLMEQRFNGLFLSRRKRDPSRLRHFSVGLALSSPSGGVARVYFEGTFGDFGTLRGRFSRRMCNVKVSAFLALRGIESPKDPSVWPPRKSFLV